MSPPSAQDAPNPVQVRAAGLSLATELEGVARHMREAIEGPGPPCAHALWRWVTEAFYLLAQGQSDLLTAAGAPAPTVGRVVHLRSERAFRELVVREAQALFATARVFDDWRFDDTTAAESRALTMAASAMRGASFQLLGAFGSDLYKDGGS